jgi:hypothetical protein
MAWSRILLSSLLSSLLVILSGARAGAVGTAFFGPTPYTSPADNVYEIEFGTCLENFEDNSLDPDGVTGNGVFIDPGPITDSVDSDDGSIDGFGRDGHSYFSPAGVAGITITFDPQRKEGLPHIAALVWTDGGVGSAITFEAFGPDGQSLGTTGPFMHADGDFGGATGEDRYYAIATSLGVSSINLRNTLGGIEVDHLFIDRCVYCGDADSNSEINTTDALIALRTGVGSAECNPCQCDANQSNSINTSDALLVLKKAVGQNPPMSCPACGF